MLFWWLLCCFLCILAVLLIIKIILLRRSMDELSESFQECLMTDTNNVIYVMSRDAHVRKLAAELNRELLLLQRQRHRYIMGDRELKEAVTNISHDLRTPLTAICGYLDLARQEEVSQELREYLECKEGRVEVLKQLTEELFAYSVLLSYEEEEGKELSLNRMLEESLLAHHGAFLAKGITPKVIIPERTIKRTLNASYLNRILANILGNALKYSEGDFKIELKTDGSITFSNRADHLTPVMVAKLFDRFYTVETGRKATGLGLSIAKLLTERIGGSIKACKEGDQLVIVLMFPE